MERYCDETRAAPRMELSALALQLAGLEHKASEFDNTEFDQCSVACPSVISTAASSSTCASSSSSDSRSSQLQRWTVEDRFTLQLAVDQCSTRRVPWKEVSTKAFSNCRSKTQLRAMNNYMKGKLKKTHNTHTDGPKRIYYCANCKQPKRSPHQCALEL